MKTEGMLPTASASLVFDRAVLDEKLLHQLKGRRVLLQVEAQPHIQTPYRQDMIGKQVSVLAVGYVNDGAREYLQVQIQEMDDLWQFVLLSQQETKEPPGKACIVRLSEPFSLQGRYALLDS